MTARGDRTRARLIEATLAVVADVGYARASTRAIADRAGVAEGTIYRHFADKTELFFAAALEPSGELLAWAASLPGRAGTGTVEANLEAWMLRLAELEEHVLPLEVAIRSDPDLARLRSAALASATTLPGPPGALTAYLAAEQGLGRVDPAVDPAEASVVLLAALFGVAFMESGPALGSRDDRVRAAVRLLARGLLPASTGA
ncbi:MAG: helix-turn-helix domain-containing protein [Chloroflexota bacterium]